jgi:bifunctional ADP-heptose synthase (sugar kinase/adenylyltransferase)
MLSRWVYILVGEDNTGKTTLQKRLIYHLCGIDVIRLDRNKTYIITHPDAPERLKTLFVISRSFQETRTDYSSIENYFKNHFKEADVCILSSHAIDCLTDIRQMIEESRTRKYNVGVVFWSNCETSENDEIALLPWSEVFRFDNQHTDNQEVWEAQIDELAQQFTELIVRRSLTQ